MLPYDPFQNFQTLGASYSGGSPQFGLPITAIQPSLQSPFIPGAFGVQPQTVPGNPGYGVFQQPFQAAGISAPINSLANILQNPFLAQQWAHHQWAQNPLAQNQFGQQGPWQNPPLAAGFQNPLLNPMLAYFGWQQLPQQLQQQPQSQLNYSLAPQSMIGGGIGQQPIASQIHPLALAALQGAYRPATGYGVPYGMGGY